MAQDSNAGQSKDALAGNLRRTELQRAPLSVPGRELVQVLTEIPSGQQSGWHTHPGEEVGYILAGTVRMEIEGHESLILHAGHGFLIPPDTAHNATDIGRETGMMVSAYIVRSGEALTTLIT